jgi:hypothetical protein
VTAPYRLTLVLDVWCWERERVLATQELLLNAVEEIPNTMLTVTPRLREVRLEECQHEPMKTVEEPEWIRRTQLEPGDTLVFKVDDFVDEDAVRVIAAQARSAFPQNEVLVLARTELEIVSEEHEQRASSA